MRALRCVSLAVCLFAGAQVYGSTTSDFQGRLVEGPNLSYDEYVIEIANVVDRSITYRADVMSDGSFMIRSVGDGDYIVHVVTLYGSEVMNSVATIGPASAGAPFEIRLPKQKLQNPGTGTVSMQQLSHPVSKQVRKLLESGQKLVAGEQFTDAAARFREAVRIDPQCVQAQADLGLALSRLQSWDGAIEAYRAATALDPRNTTLHSNLSGVLASANRFDEARNEASLALKLDPANARAHYVMAAALLHVPGHTQEVVSHLAAAKDTFPSARTALENICAHGSFTGCR